MWNVAPIWVFGGGRGTLRLVLSGTCLWTRLVCGGAVRVGTMLERRLEENVTRNILMALLWGATMCACSDRVTWVLLVGDASQWAANRLPMGSAAIAGDAAAPSASPKGFFGEDSVLWGEWLDRAPGLGKRWPYPCSHL